MTLAVAATSRSAASWSRSNSPSARRNRRARRPERGRQVDRGASDRRAASDRLGSVAFDERVWDDPAGDVFVSPRRRVGAMFQSYLLFDHLSALDNVAFGLRPGSRQQPPERRRMPPSATRGRTLTYRMPAPCGGQRTDRGPRRALVLHRGSCCSTNRWRRSTPRARGAVRHDLPGWLNEIRTATAARLPVSSSPTTRSTHTPWPTASSYSRRPRHPDRHLDELASGHVRRTSPTCWVSTC